MDRPTKKAILKNRVKLLSLDYFDLTGPLLAAEVLSSKKHKDIKKAAPLSKARVDLLLDWMEDSAPKDAFPLFLQGIRNCQEPLLAKRIKKEATGADPGPSSTTTSGAKQKSTPKPKKPTTSSIDLDKILADIIPSLPSTFASKAASTSVPPPTSTDKPKKPKKSKAPIPGPPNGLPSTLLPPPPLPTNAPPSKKRKAEPSDPKVKLPKPPRSTPTPTPSTKQPTPAKTTPKAKKQQNGSNTTPAPTLPTTPRTTRKSSSSDIVQIKGKAAKSTKKAKQDKKSAPAVSSPKVAGKGATSPMTFKEVDDKQQDFKGKFKFTNSNAVTRSILFKDKSDITYLGCPFLASNKMCGKKVELKSKEFICEAKHKSPNCRQIPRLQVTCNDGTADLLLTLMKQNVEIFTGKSETEIETMSVDEIKVVLDKTTGKKLAVEVTSEKAKKGAVKKGASVRWNNVATIITDTSDAPPAKKKRKN